MARIGIVLFLIQRESRIKTKQNKTSKQTATTTKKYPTPKSTTTKKTQSEKFYFSKKIISGHPDYLGPYSIQSRFFFCPIVQVSNPTARNLEILVEVSYGVFSNLFGARKIPNKTPVF